MGQDDPGEVINRVPQPPLMGFAPHETPHLIDLCCLHAVHFDRDCLRTASLPNPCVHRRERGSLFFNSPITVVGLTWRTRAIARTPLPLSVISTICRFTSGTRPGYA